MLANTSQRGQFLSSPATLLSVASQKARKVHRDLYPFLTVAGKQKLCSCPSGEEWVNEGCRPPPPVEWYCLESEVPGVARS